MGWERNEVDFRPEVGFLLRNNYQSIYTELQFNPRPDFLPFFRQMEFKPLDIEYYFNDETGQLISLSAEFRPIGFKTKSGEFIEFNIIREAQNLIEYFPIHDGIEIPSGEYWFTRYEIQANTFNGRPLFGAGQCSIGDFYNGTQTSLELMIVYRASKYFSFSVDGEQNSISLPGGSFITRDYGGRVEYAFNPNLFGSFFGQWNNDDNETLFNFRFSWIPKPGANFYFILNQSFDTNNNRWKGKNTAILTKLVWRFEI